MGVRIPKPVALLAAVVLTLVMAACGDDAPGLPSDGEAPPGDVGIWCARVIEYDEFLMSRDPVFAEEDLPALAAEVLPVWSRVVPNAPAEISAEVTLITEGYTRLAAGDFTVFDDPRYDDAFWDFEDFVFDVCDYEMAG